MGRTRVTLRTGQLPFSSFPKAAISSKSVLVSFFVHLPVPPGSSASLFILSRQLSFPPEGQPPFSPSCSAHYSSCKVSFPFLLSGQLSFLPVLSSHLSARRSASVSSFLFFSLFLLSGQLPFPPVPSSHLSARWSAYVPSSFFRLLFLLSG
jgi:hypothetical protein